MLLCATDGAAPGACVGVDLTRAPTLPSEDGGVTTGFYRLTDGAIAGGWPEPGDPEGPPPEGWTPPGVHADDWLPDAGIASCAPGWIRLADGTCDPALRTECGDGSHALPGGACTPTGASSCPAGDYATLGAEAVGAAVAHVRAGAEVVGADGSEGHPFASLTEGIARAGSGGWVLVAAGEYREPLRVARGFVAHIVGACAARVTVRGPGPLGRDGAAVSASGEGTLLDLRGVTVTGGGRGLQAVEQATLHASGVAVVASSEFALDVRDARTAVTLTGCVVRGTLTRPDGTAGYGVSVQSGASVRVAATWISDNTGAGVSGFDPGTRIELIDSTVRETRTRPGGNAAHGLDVSERVELVVSGSVVEGSGEIGVSVVGAETRAELRWTVVRTTRPRSDGRSGAGVSVSGGAHLQATDVLVDRNAAYGLAAFDEGTVVTLSHAVVRATAPESDGGRGVGLAASGGAQVDATAVLVAGNAEAGVLSEGSRVDLRECLVRDTAAPESAVARGFGLAVSEGGVLTAVDVALVANTSSGVFATGGGTRVELSGGVVRDTRADAVSSGNGLTALGGASIRAARTVLFRNRLSGAIASGLGSQIELASSVVRGTLPWVNGRFGRGMSVEAGATASASGVLFAENTEGGVVAIGEGTRVELASCVVRDTRARPDAMGGAGVVVSEGASLRATRALLDGNTGVGVVAHDDGTHVELTASTVRATRLPAGGLGGAGLAAITGASIRAEGVRVVDSPDVGAYVGEGSRFELSSSVIRGTRPNPDGLFGRAVMVQANASLRARGVLLDESAEAGLWAHGEGAAVALEDVVVLNVVRSARGFGVGAAVSGGAQLEGVRVAVQNVAGAGVLALPFMNATGTLARVRDLFVRGVRTSTVQANEAGPSVGTRGGSVAYGLHAGLGCTVDVTRALLLDGGFGFYNAGGTVRVRQGMIAGQLDAAGATDLATSERATALTDVALRGNARDAVVRVGGLPSASSLPAPPPPHL